MLSCTILKFFFGWMTIFLFIRSTYNFSLHPLTCKEIGKIDWGLVWGLFVISPLFITQLVHQCTALITDQHVSNHICKQMNSLRVKTLHKESSPESERRLGHQYGGREPGLYQGDVVRGEVFRQLLQEPVHRQHLGQETTGNTTSHISYINLQISIHVHL